MVYVTIDGDDVGQKITSSYLSNDVMKLISINEYVNSATSRISEILAYNGFVIIFCAADGVAGYSFDDAVNVEFLYSEIQKNADFGITFSMGVGNSLKDSFIALISAKSNGKNQFCNLMAM
ncbi:TPA: mCpol domain-containing protein [Providencia rettgeri]